MPYCISKGKKYSKASARSVKGFDIIEFIRTAQEFLVDAGGHPMAAGFTIETIKLPLLQKALEDKAELMLNKDLLPRNLRISKSLFSINSALSSKAFCNKGSFIVSIVNPAAIG